MLSTDLTVQSSLWLKMYGPGAVVLQIFGDTPPLIRCGGTHSGRVDLQGKNNGYFKWIMKQFYRMHQRFLRG